MLRFTCLSKQVSNWLQVLQPMFRHRHHLVFCWFIAGVSTSSASTSFLGVTMIVPSARVTSTKSPSRSPSSSQISLGIITCRRWPSLLMGIAGLRMDYGGILIGIPSDYQTQERCQALPGDPPDPGRGDMLG
jgi:hypothetical protein